MGLSGTRIRDGSHCTARFLRSLPQDPYRVLGLDRDATQKQIRQAHRQLSLQYHPDKAGIDAARFNAIQTAYETLSDPDKKAAYDSFGSKHFTSREDWLKALRRGDVTRSSGLYSEGGIVQSLTKSNFSTFTNQ